MNKNTIAGAIAENFLGDTPKWYKLLIISYLIINPIIFAIDPFLAGWILIIEFISTLALALVCYPLPSGGLLAVEAVAIGMTKPETVYHHVMDNFPVILLLMFMVAGIFFMKELLLFIFTRLLVKIKSKIGLSLIFCFLGTFLSAFLDALTVTAVATTVAFGFYRIYHQYASSKKSQEVVPCKNDDYIDPIDKEDLENFRGFLRNLMMHAAVGTTLGGALTLVGEPQNLLIGEKMGWNFMEFLHECSPVSIPVLLSGLATCFFVETTKILGYGYRLPDNVRKVLEAEVRKTSETMDSKTIGRFIVEALAGIFLILALAFHLAEVGLVGLTIIILVTAFTGITEEHQFGESFKESLPFTALLVVFFTVVAVIDTQDLFAPIMNGVFKIDGKAQIMAFFAANGILSAISDNVFVATVYITEAEKHFRGTMPDGTFVKALNELDPVKALQFNHTAVAINMGTNIPSVATPNGQAAFLFLLTSTLAPLIKLSYMQMIKLALPYTIIMTTVAALATYYNL